MPEKDANTRIALNQLNIEAFAKRDGVTAWHLCDDLCRYESPCYTQYSPRELATAFIFNIGYNVVSILVIFIFIYI